MKKRINSEKAFRIFTYITLLILAVICILPIILVVVASVTDEHVLLAKGYRFFPEKLSLAAYGYLWKQSEMMLQAYGVSIFVTVVGTCLSLVLSTLFAYPLSRRDFKSRNFFNECV